MSEAECGLTLRVISLLKYVCLYVFHVLELAKLKTENKVEYLPFRNRPPLVRPISDRLLSSNDYFSKSQSMLSRKNLKVDFLVKWKKCQLNLEMLEVSETIIFTKTQKPF